MVKTITFTRYFLATLKPGLMRVVKAIALFIAAMAAITLLLLMFGLMTRSYAWTYHNPMYINGHSDQTVMTIGTSPDDNSVDIISLTQPTRTYFIGDTFYGGTETGIAFYSWLIPLAFFLTCAFFSFILVLRRIVHGDVLH